MTGYEELIEAAIQKQVELTNEEVAIRQARKVPDLDLADDGTVTELNGPGKRVLEEVVDAYAELMGEVAESLIAYELRDKFDLDEIELPDNLSAHL